MPPRRASPCPRRPRALLPPTALDSSGAGGPAGRRMGRPLARLADALAGPAARAALVVALVTAVLVLPPVGTRLVATTDEARFILYAREVVTHGALFDVRLRGKLFREK